MIQLMRLQLAGALLVTAALLSAELAAMALAASPGSALLWRLNLEFFRAVNATYWMADAIIPLDLRITIPALLTLLGVSIAAYLWKARLALAVLSNLAFIYCGALAYASFVPVTGAAVASASPVPVAISFDSGAGLVLYLLLASLCGAAASHLGYFLRFVRRRKGAAATSRYNSAPA
ncbi:MAG TPA: hypothetical protein VHG92_14710 [Afifellaceae bacterium]|nr:hypothetical protein [Afifellaceae bacterium]